MDWHRPALQLGSESQLWQDQQGSSGGARTDTRGKTESWKLKLFRAELQRRFQSNMFPEFQSFRYAQNRIS